MSSHSGNRANARHIGAKVEEYAEDERGVACLNGTVDGELISGDLVVEVKGVVIAYSAPGAPEGGRVGRVRFWQRQHEQLREGDGVYLVVVYSTQEPDPVQYDRFVHWSSLESVMEEHGYSWYAAREHPMRSKQTQIPWSRFFPELELSS